MALKSALSVFSKNNPSTGDDNIQIVILLIIAGAALLLLAGAFVFFFVKRRKDNEKSQNAAGTALSPEFDASPSGDVAEDESNPES